MSLEFTETRDLVNELRNRTTFAGIIIWSDVEQKNQKIHDTSYLNIFTAFEKAATIEILDTAIKKVSQCQ